MAVKTFTTEVLTSADTNTYLANSGLVYVTSATIGSGVSSVTVSSAFSATYDNYRIVVSGGIANGAINISMSLGSSVTGYYYALVYSTYAAAVPTAALSNNAAAWGFVGYSQTDSNAASFDLINPFAAKFTQIHAAGWAALTAAGTGSGVHQVASSFTAFTLTNGGTFTGGTITVYGYRKA